MIKLSQTFYNLKKKFKHHVINATFQNVNEFMVVSMYTVIMRFCLSEIHFEQRLIFHLFYHSSLISSVLQCLLHVVLHEPCSASAMALDDLSSWR